MFAKKVLSFPAHKKFALLDQKKMFLPKFFEAFSLEAKSLEESKRMIREDLASKGRHRFQRIEDVKYPNVLIGEMSRQANVKKVKSDDYGGKQVLLTKERSELRWRLGRVVSFHTGSNSYQWSIRDVELLLSSYSFSEVQRTAVHSGLPGHAFNIKFASKSEAERFFKENHRKTMLWTRPSIKTAVHLFFSSLHYLKKHDFSSSYSDNTHNS